MDLNRITEYCLTMSARAAICINIHFYGLWKRKVKQFDNDFQVGDIPKRTTKPTRKEKTPSNCIPPIDKIQFVPEANNELV